MKKFVLVLVLVALATPAWAGVTVSCTAGAGADCNLVTVSYNNTEANNVRAFALDITISTGTIVAVSDLNADYDTYPGSIVIVDGVVTNVGTPVCDGVKYPGTLGGLGTGGMTIEMGSLYQQGVESAPAKNGTLLKFRASGKTGTVSIVGNTARGGAVIMENPDQVITPSLTGCSIVCVAQECLKNVLPAEYNAWVAFNRPNCWCYKRQCRGDINGTISMGVPVSTADLNMLKSAFNKNDTILTTITNGICSDLNHAASMGVRVSTADLNILKTYFNKNGTIASCCDADNDCVLTSTDKFNSWTN